MTLLLLVLKTVFAGQCLDGDANGDRVIWQRECSKLCAATMTSDILATSEVDSSGVNIIRFYNNTDYPMQDSYFFVKVPLVLSLKFRPLFKQIAVATDTGVLVLTNDGLLVTKLTAARPHTIFEMAWSPDGKILLSSFYNASARLNNTGVEVWDVATSTLLTTLPHEVAVFEMSWSSTGKYFLTASADAVYLWNASSLERIRKVGWSTGAWSPDGEKIVTLATNNAGIGNVTVLDLEGNILYQRSHFPGVNKLSWRNDPYQVGIGSADGLVTIWDIRSPIPLLSGFQGPDGVGQLEWSSDGSKLFTQQTRNANILTIWDASPGPALRAMGGIVGAQLNLNTAAFTDDYVLLGRHSSLEIRDMTTWEQYGLVPPIEDCGRMDTAVWSPDRSRVALMCSSARVLVFDLITNSTPWSFITRCDITQPQRRGVDDGSLQSRLARGSTSLTWDLLNSDLLFYYYNNKTHGIVATVYVSSCDVQQFFTTTEAISDNVAVAVASSPPTTPSGLEEESHNYLAVGGSRWLRIWNLSTNNIIYENLNPHSVQALAWNSNGSLLAIVGSDVVTIRNTLDKSIRTLSLQFSADQGKTAAFDPLGWLLAVGTTHGVAMCEVQAGSCFPLLPTENPVTVWFTLSGLLYSADQSTAVRVWARPTRVISVTPPQPPVNEPYDATVIGNGLMGVDKMVLRYQYPEVHKGRQCEYIQVKHRTDTEIIFEASPRLELRYYQVLLHSKYTDPPWSVVSPMGFTPSCPPYALSIFTDPFIGKCECHEGHYASAECSAGALQCLPCPIHAKCLGNTTARTMIAQDNYWRSGPPDLIPPSFERCSAHACVNGGCATGYQGPLCGSCQPGFGQSGFNVCKKCPNNTRNTIVLTAQTVAAIVMVGLLTYFATSATPRQRKSPNSQLLSILLSAVQVNTMLLNVDVNLPEEVENLLENQSAMQAATTSIYSFSCAALSLGVKSEEIVYLKLRISALIPLFVPILLFFLLTIFNVLRVCVRKRIVSLHSSPTSSSSAYSASSSLRWLPSPRIPITCGIICLFTLYPALCSLAFQIMSCRPIDGQSLLTNDLSVSCDTPIHRRQLVIVALVVMFYITLAPMLVALALYRGSRVPKRRTNLGASTSASVGSENNRQSDSNRSSGIESNGGSSSSSSSSSSSGRDHDGVVGRVAIFPQSGPHLYVMHMRSGFQVEWWFMVILIRKVLLAALSTFLWSSAPLQLVLISLSLVIFLALHTWYQPFKFYHSNLAESASLLTSTTLFAFSQLLSYPGVDDVVDIGTVSWVLVITPAVFVAFVLALAIHAKWQSRKRAKSPPSEMNYTLLK